MIEMWDWEGGGRGERGGLWAGIGEGLGMGGI